MNKANTILGGLLTTLFKLSNDEVADLLTKADGDDFDTESTLNDLLSKDKTRVNKLATERFDQGHKKGKAESLDSLETQVREEYGISDEFKGLELIKAVHSLDREKNKTGITDDDVKKSAAYITLQKRLDDLNKDVEKKVTEATTAAETKFNRERTLNKAKAEALKELSVLKPVLSADEKRAAKQQELYLKEIEGYDFDLSDDGTLIVKKDGKALDDGHGNLIDFNTLVKSTASSMFDFKHSEDRQSAGNKTDYKGPIAIPKTEDEYNKKMLDSSIPVAERLAIKEAWNKV